MDKNRKSLKTRIWENRQLYLLVLPFLVWLFVFHYAPMGGAVLAFKEYKARLGIFGSPWVGLANFRRIFITPAAKQAILNTLLISLERLIFEFPMGIIFAILITEMPGRRLKKVFQTVSTFPHFLSWVVVAAIVSNFFSAKGAVNQVIISAGGEAVNFMAVRAWFRPLLYISGNWKEMGWSSIVYLAAITGIDPTLYEAARIDGASRLQQIRHVTLPGIKSTIAIMFILKVGNVMNAGFDQVFNLRNSALGDVAQILDTYVYDITFLATPKYGFSTAVGLFKAVINFIMLIVANRVVYKLTDHKLFG